MTRKNKPTIHFVDLTAQQKIIRSKIENRIKNVLNHGKYIMGPEVFELEEKLADYLGVKHCITCSSGTDALLMAKMSLGIEVGDEVILPSFTWVATAETIALLGAVPVFVDINEKNFNIDIDQLESCITEKTKAIIPVSLFGQTPDMDRINKIAQKHNISVIEDGAQSFGASYKDKKSCSLTTIGCTSFFPAKPLGCYGDGGACFTDNDELAEKMRWIRVHGQKRRGDIRLIGINGRLDTIQAAILLEKLAIFPEEIIKRQQVAHMYQELLGDSVEKPYIDEGNTSVYAQYAVKSSKRDEIKEKLREKNIPTAINYPKSICEYPLYKEKGKFTYDMKISKKIARKVLCLPMHPYLGEKEVIEISRIIVKSVSL